MKIFKNKALGDTSCRVVRDDRGNFYGVLGTVGDLLKVELLISADISPDAWALISSDSRRDVFAMTRAELMAELEEAGI